MELLRAAGNAGRWIVGGLLLAGTCLAGGSVAAPVTGALVVSANDQRLIDQSLSIGAALHAFDRAASLSTAVLLRRMNRAQLAGDGGYVVERGAGGVLRVTYYHGPASEGRAFFVVHIIAGEVTREEMLPIPVPLSAGQTRMAAAREAASQAALAQGYTPCTVAPFNSVVLPIEGDAHAVYLLSAQAERGRYPIGGHYRIVIGPDGKMLSSRPFSVGCLNLDVPGPASGGKPEGLMTSNRLDSVPTEVLVFATHSLGMPLYVVTRDHRMWKVDGKRIALQGED